MCDPHTELLSDNARELAAVTAERNRAQQACQQMGERLNKASATLVEIAAVEVDWMTGVTSATEAIAAISEILKEGKQGAAGV